MNDKQTALEPEQIKAMDREQLLQKYDRFIWKIVNRFKKTAANYAWIDEADLYQVAAMALLKAQESYNPEGEAAFMTFAYKVIRRKLYRALHIEATPTGYTYEPIILSLDEPINEDGDITRSDTIQSDGEPLDDMAERADISARVRAAVRTLPEIQKEIINRLYLNDPTETRPEIAKDKGVSPSAIGRQKEKAFKNLRYKLRSLQPEMPRHVGLSQFRSHWTSEPEQYVLTREKRFEQWLKEYEEFIENFERIET